MKQNITKSQWDELSQEQKTKFCDFFEDKEYFLGMNDPISIGTMIEFLGDDWVDMYKETFFCMTVEDYIPIDEMCDHLWEACKNKLNK